jgi:hypothetical protein
LQDLTEEEWTGIKEFLALKCANNLVPSETKIELLNLFCGKLKKSEEPNEWLLEATQILLTSELMKEVFKNSQEIFMKLTLNLVKSYFNLICGDSGFKNPNILEDVFKELLFYCKVKTFKELFLSELFNSLFELVKFLKDNFDDSIHYENFLDLVSKSYFSQVGIDDSVEEGAVFDIFKEELDEVKLFGLVEAFFKANRTKPGEVTKLVKLIIQDKVSGKEGIELLSSLQQIYQLLRKYELDIRGINRENKDAFEEVEEKVQEVMESLEDQTNLTKFLETLNSLIELDPFLLKDNIYEILVNTLFKEKSLLENDRFEKFLATVFTIYGKDVIYFTKNLMEAIENKLENYKLPKKRKRKLSGGPESKKKRAKKADGSDEDSFVESDSGAQKLWPDSFNLQFCDSIASLNVKQSLKLWNSMNGYLQKYLVDLKEAGAPTENLLFKLELITNLISQFFVASRLHEHLSYKYEMILEEIESFNKIQDHFHSLILNIEYNNRLMNAFLVLSHNYENFLLLYFYHYNPEVKSKLTPSFLNNKFGKSNEWIVIKQRIKNFGKIQEKNNANLLGLQHYLKSLLLEKNDRKMEDLEIILSDPKQIEFLLGKAELKSLFLQILKPEELGILAGYLIETGDTKIIGTISGNPKQLELFFQKFMDELVEVQDGKVSLKIEDFGKIEKVYGILKQFPLGFLETEKKKLLFSLLMEVQEKFQESELDFSPILSEILANDGYKNFLKDFQLKTLLNTFKDTTKFQKIYHLICFSAIRRMNQETLENFKYFTEIQEIDENQLFLLEMILQIFSEVTITATGVSNDAIKKVRVDLINILLKHYTGKEKSKKKVETLTKFEFLLKIGVKNFAELEKDLKKEFLEKLEVLIRFAIRSENEEALQLLLTTLSNSKVLNLSEEIKNSSVEALFGFLKKLVAENVQKNDAKLGLENQILDVLKPFKATVGSEVLNFLRESLKAACLNADKVTYSYQLLEVIFKKFLEPGNSNPVIVKKREELLESATKFSAEILPRLGQLEDENKVPVLCQVLDTFVVALKTKMVSFALT